MSPYPNSIDFRYFLSIARDDPSWAFYNFYDASGRNLNLDSFSDLGTLFDSIEFYVSDIPFNYARVLAYQLACAEFFTNDNVDHIYSAELYRQYIGSLLNNLSTYGGDFQKFSYNGVYCDYDILSAHKLSAIYAWNMTDFTGLFNDNDYIINLMSLAFALFGYNRSLRYKDYFVSSRVRPLAVGDVSVSVANNSVSVIDVTRNIQKQRFLNLVNHTGRRLSNYIKSLFGVNISEDRHVPHWIADLDELVYTSEVENTGSNQFDLPNSVTAVFTGNSSNYELHFGVDVPSFIIGLTSYDIERAYSDSINRSFFIKDRFDMFLPEMQYLGDQEIYQQELNSSSLVSMPFGYQYRDMQYKLFYPVVDGGFVEFLPGYSFRYKPAYYGNDFISPSFIRAVPNELDDLYLSLTGYSLASYFHFISIITNSFVAKRPMVSNPKILE